MQEYILPNIEKPKECPSDVWTSITVFFNHALRYYEETKSVLSAVNHLIKTGEYDDHFKARKWNITNAEHDKVIFEHELYTTEKILKLFDDAVVFSSTEAEFRNCAMSVPAYYALLLGPLEYENFTAETSAAYRNKQDSRRLMPS